MPAVSTPESSRHLVICGVTAWAGRSAHRQQRAERPALREPRPDRDWADLHADRRISARPRSGCRWRSVVGSGAVPISETGATLGAVRAAILPLLWRPCPRSCRRSSVLAMPWVSRLWADRRPGAGCRL